MRALKLLALGALLLGAAVSGAAVDLEDLLMNLQVVPLDGDAPPPFTLQSLDGRKVSLSDFRERPVLLYFWASW